MLAAVPDPRARRGVRHRLATVVAASMCAVVAGYRSYAAIAEWVTDLPGQAAVALGMDPARRPSESMIRRLLQALDPQRLSTVLGGWFHQRLPHPPVGDRRAIAVDGKTMRGSGDADTPAGHVLCHDDSVLDLPGYADDPLVDGCQVLDDPLFWPVHLLQYTHGEADELCAAFDVDEAEMWRCYSRLSDEHRWPVFSIGLPSGHSISLVYRNFKEDSGYDYHLHHPRWAEPVLLATIEGHYLGPGMCWGELVTVSRSGSLSGAVLSAQGLMLLLLPVMADTGLPADAVNELAGALQAFGAMRQPRRLAQLLLEGQGTWGPQPWQLVGDRRISAADRYATRSPDVMSDAILAEITTAFGAVPPR
ncbi:transposase family protein [Phytohabitans kaempferiae]|uniref:Transposase family protein n=1 Tax=Phytohabitans kaempferiae TaxID=1620943 RepID=A0ABV6MDH8_9ACTN